MPRVVKKNGPAEGPILSETSDSTLPYKAASKKYSVSQGKLKYVRSVLRNQINTYSIEHNLKPSSILLAKLPPVQG